MADNCPRCVDLAAERDELEAERSKWRHDAEANELASRQMVETIKLLRGKLSMIYSASKRGLEAQ
jgi:hypothetical protein